MLKQVFLPIAAVIAFIAMVGIFTQKSQEGKIALIRTPTPTSLAKKEIKVGTKTLMVEIADTDEKRGKGLSGRESLPQNEGMLFVFEEKDVQPYFWMKEMKFPIDIIWINDARIVKIDKNVPIPTAGVSANQLPRYTPNQPIDYVLEVGAGFSDKNKVKVGDSYEGYQD